MLLAVAFWQFYLNRWLVKLWVPHSRQRLRACLLGMQDSMTALLLVACYTVSCCLPVHLEKFWLLWPLLAYPVPVHQPYIRSATVSWLLLHGLLWCQDGYIFSFQRECECHQLDVNLSDAHDFCYSLIPVAIVGAKRFYTTFVDILSTSLTYRYRLLVLTCWSLRHCWILVISVLCNNTYRAYAIPTSLIFWGSIPHHDLGFIWFLA